MKFKSLFRYLIYAMTACFITSVLSDNNKIYLINNCNGEKTPPHTNNVHAYCFGSKSKEHGSGARGNINAPFWCSEMIVEAIGNNFFEGIRTLINERAVVSMSKGTPTVVCENAEHHLYDKAGIDRSHTLYCACKQKN